jgi:hypothetical protein
MRWLVLGILCKAYPEVADFVAEAAEEIGEGASLPQFASTPIQ